MNMIHNLAAVISEAKAQAYEEAARVNDELALEAAANSEWNAKTDLERGAAKIRALKDQLVPVPQAA